MYSSTKFGVAHFVFQGERMNVEQNLYVFKVVATIMENMKMKII